ncbi:MAG TPA: ATP-binding protein [Aquabacterium sp.]|nr:ATP-binding protein [Aquabacterium sp.]HQC95134.1 ATP-binding protein [Aquabacterium sp.]
MTAGAPTPLAGTGIATHNRLAAGRRRRALAFALVGLAVLMLWLRLLATEPHLPLHLKPGHGSQVLLAPGSAVDLPAMIGQPLQALLLPDGTRLEARRALLPQSARWTVDDDERRQLLALRAQLRLPVDGAAVTLLLADGGQTSARARPRGLAGLGALCWALCGLALALYLAAVRTVLLQPGAAARLYLLAAVAQALNLLLMAAASRPGLALAATGVPSDPVWRLLLDAFTGAALVHVLALHPQRQPHAHAIGLLAWGTTGALGAWLLLADPPGLWWWSQLLALGCGVAAAWLLRHRSGQARSPLARLQQHLVLAGTGTLGLLSLAVALDGRALPDTLANLGTVAWYVFFASLLMLGPHLSRARQVLREFMLLAGTCTVAASLTLLALAVFGLHPLGALVLVLAATLGLYALARPWVLGQLAGPAALSPERMFDSLYRAARALEQSPGDTARQLATLLRAVFDPLALDTSSRQAARVRVAGDGSTLVVPVPRPAGSRGGGASAGTLVLRHARRGRRLFTAADGQLCEQLLEQLARAVEHDRAVERGRAEERARIAQDLHDDIGARLLTLMYQAPNPEIEGYIRHTLQDLKTLTRGLAASDQRLSHAAAEWKADITQRLAIAGCTLQWTFSADRDLRLSAVQWSALTRVLRELVNNIITHARASRVEIGLHLDNGHLLLDVDDDGIGTEPAAWSHGLGLGGVRKRVKLLGGQVAWSVRDGGGIRCEVRAPLGEAAGDARPHG